MSQFKEGIYLETKQGRLGTGHTSSNVVFKNYYAARQVGEKVEMFLLDDDMGLTGLREQVSLKSFTGKYQYQPQLQERYQDISAGLPPLPGQAAPQQRQEATPPQTRPAAQPPQTRPPAQAPQKRQPAPAPAEQSGDTPWWEMTSKGSGGLFKK